MEYLCSQKIDRCRNCTATSQEKFKISKQELEDLIFVEKLSFTKIGKKFGVSNNAIRKRCIKYGIKYKNT